MATELHDRPHLLTLPLELTTVIWQHLDRKTLKSLRSTSKTCWRHSTQPLFRSFTIYPHIRSFNRLIQLSEEPRVAQYVEDLHYDTILLGLTEIINRRLASVYSAQICDAERKEVVSHARQMHDQTLRADAPWDELAQLSYLQQILPNLPNLKSFTVVDVTGLQRPSYQLTSRLPHFYQQLVDETCGRFEHTRLERDMWGTPRCHRGAYSRPVIMSLYKASKPIERLVLRGIRWPALLSSDITKHTSLIQGVFSRIKVFEMVQSHDPLFPGPICMARLQQILSCMLSLESLALGLREGHEIDVKGVGKELRDMDNDIRCVSHFSGKAVNVAGATLPARLNWSSKLRHLMLTGMVCSGKEMQSLLRHCSSSLRVLQLGDLVLTPEVFDGPRSCLVNLIRWIQSRLKLERIELFGTLTNGGMQDWFVDPPGRFINESESLSAQVHRYILNGGDCPLDHVAIPAEYFDVGKESHTAELPECLENRACAGDATWMMSYCEEEAERGEQSEWTTSDDDDDDDDDDMIFGVDPEVDDDRNVFSNSGTHTTLPTFWQNSFLPNVQGFIEDVDDGPDIAD